MHKGSDESLVFWEGRSSVQDFVSLKKGAVDEQHEQGYAFTVSNTHTMNWPWLDQGPQREGVVGIVSNPRSSGG